MVLLTSSGSAGANTDVEASNKVAGAGDDVLELAAALEALELAASTVDDWCDMRAGEKQERPVLTQ